MIIPLQSRASGGSAADCAFGWEHRVVQVINRGGGHALHRDYVHRVDGGGFRRCQEIIAVISLIGGDIVSLTTGSIGRDPIRHKHSEGRKSCFQLDSLTIGRAVPVAKISQDPGVVLQSQRLNPGENGIFDIEDPNGIRFLESHHSRFAIRGDGDVFGLQIDRSRIAREDTDTSRTQGGFLTIILREGDCLRGWKGKPAGYINDADGAFRIAATGR